MYPISVLGWILTFTCRIQLIKIYYSVYISLVRTISTLISAHIYFEFLATVTVSTQVARLNFCSALRYPLSMCRWKQRQPDRQFQITKTDTHQTRNVVYVSWYTSDTFLSLNVKLSELQYLFYMIMPLSFFSLKLIS